MAGWVKLHREIYDSDLWCDAVTFRLFILIIGKASHQDGVKVNGVELKKGQWIRSYRKLAEDLAYKEGRGTKQYSLSTIKRSVHKLIESGRVSIHETELGTLFTVLNYAEYQDFKDLAEETTNGTRNEVRTNPERTQNKNKNARMQECKKNNNTKRLDFDEKHMKLAALLWKFIQGHNPSAKKPNLEKWANTFRLMMERDGREGKEIQNLIKWSTNHHFWYKNILSPDKLRKQYDRLVIEMNDDNRGGRPVAIAERTIDEGERYSFESRNPWGKNVREVRKDVSSY